MVNSLQYQLVMRCILPENPLLRAINSLSLED